MSEQYSFSLSMHSFISSGDSEWLCCKWKIKTLFLVTADLHPGTEQWNRIPSCCSL